MALSDRTWRERLLIKDLDKVKAEHEVLKRYVATLKLKISSLSIDNADLKVNYIALLENYKELVHANELMVVKWEALVEDINLKGKVN